ncbi:MAG: sigma-70 family RNA polymerase sigma factor [Zavarzinella sp.]
MTNDDRQLIARCLQGDSSAYEPLVLRYQDRLYNAVFRMLNSAEDAADVVQEAFIGAYQSLHSFKGESGFFTWLYRIAFNVAISLKRKRRIAASLDWDSGERQFPEPVEDNPNIHPDKNLERSEEEELLQKALDRLTNEHRMIIILNDIQDEKYEDIAEILGIPIGTVRSRVHRARAELRSIIMELEGLTE